MPRDNRLYFKLTLDFPDHAKIFPLSDAAFRCFVEAIAYCRRQETDGLLARRYALAKWSPEVLRELCENDPEKPSLIERPDGWLIHDYADINDTAAEIEARRERNRQAGKQGGLAKSYRSAKRTASKSLSNSVSESLAEEEKKIPTYVGNPPYVRNARETAAVVPIAKADGRGNALARFERINDTARSPEANAIAQAFSASLPVPVETGVLCQVAVQIDKCLRDEIPPPAIAAGIRAWQASDSWSPNLIPNFVMKANRGTGHGKATVKALGYQDAAAELLAEMSRA